MRGIRRFYQLIVAFLVFIVLAPLPWFSMGVLPVIGLSVEDDIPLEYWVSYGVFVFLGLVAVLVIRKCYPDKIPQVLRPKKKKVD